MSMSYVTRSLQSRVSTTHRSYSQMMFFSIFIMSITLFIKAKHVSYAMYSFKSMSYAVVCFTVQIYNPPTAYMHCSALPASDCSTRRYFSRQKKKKIVVENCMKNSCWYHLRCVDDSRRSKPCLVLIINIFGCVRYSGQRYP